MQIKCKTYTLLFIPYSSLIWGDITNVCQVSIDVDDRVLPFLSDSNVFTIYLQNIESIKIKMIIKFCMSDDRFLFMYFFVSW